MVCTNSEILNTAHDVSVKIHSELPWGILITTINTIPTADKIIKPVDTVEGANRALGTPNFEINTISLESDRF